MSAQGHGKEDINNSRGHKTPYSARHPIPTVSKYEEEKERRRQNAISESDNDNEAQANQLFDNDEDGSYDNGQDNGGNNEPKDTSEVGGGASDVKTRRKEMKKNNKNSKKERAKREVTDPVTHLPITIQDFTDDALKNTDHNDTPFGQTPRTSTGMSNKRKSGDQLEEEKNDMQDGHNFLINRFPPPDFDALRQELVTINKQGISFALGGVALVLVGTMAIEKWLRKDGFWGEDGFHMFSTFGWVLLLGFSFGGMAMLIIASRDWIAKRVNGVFEDEVWDAHHRQIQDDAAKHENETTAWLNSLIGSVWPLVNPDLFAGVADMLEDVMQASLPRFVRMISVEDIGQGSESLRILGVRWLPTGAAAKSVTEGGELTEKEENEADTNEEKSGSGNEDTGEEKKDKDGNAVAEGMDAEEGEFVNLEVAFAYRARSTSKTLKERTKDMHLYLAFYLPGNIKVPVWVDLQGIVGTMRVRLQLTPDPPFFQLATITLLGQPKVNLSCVPLSKHALNIMDVPFISNFVQSSVDAAMAEYVAPKSLSLNLKDMLVGDDFKKDTNAKGVLVVNIKRGYDFKMGDSGIPLIKNGGSDPYVSVGWAKFGKVLWSTRIIVQEMQPFWDEVCYVLVTPAELNVDERLRIQLWDSDHMTADDDLGRIEIDLKHLMRSDESNGKMWQRTDGFRALKSGDNMPGKLEWSVGYFSKARLQDSQFEKQTYDPDIKNQKQLEDKVHESCEKKLRETMFKEGREERDNDELEQQKQQQMKEEEDAMIISAPPPENFPSGIFSIQVHNITGLELEKLSKDPKEDDNQEEAEDGQGMPSAYCTIIINHKKQFKTRTKPQNAKPFFNAGCERFIGDWQECEVMVSVRDARIDEDDALLGVVHLPLHEIFKERSQVMGFWPLAGGVGHGRVRLSMVWRSLQLQAPTNMLGWDYGTIEIQSRATSDLPEDLHSAKLKFKTTLDKGKMKPDNGEDGKMGKGGGGGEWTIKKGRKMYLAVQKRYSSCLSIALRKKGGLGGESVEAFAIVWLKDLADEEETTMDVAVWKGDFKRAKANCYGEYGERVGSIKLTMTFWAGLGEAHSKFCSKSQNLREVVEVIDTARDTLCATQKEQEAGIVDADESESDSDSDDSDDSDYDDDDDKGGKNGGKRKSQSPDGSEGNEMGPIDRIKDYKKKDKTLHRKHRGIMQWKIPRTAKWAKHKVEDVAKGAKGLTERHSEGGGIETEV